MNNRCQCGRKKYPDAILCQRCWNNEECLDRRNGDNNYCQCGNGKYPDAPCCSECWDRGSGYGDR